MRPFGGDSLVLWSAFNSPRGFTALFQTTAVESCGARELLLYPSMSRLQQFYRIPLQPGEGPIWVSQPVDQQAGIYSEVEITWELLGVDSSGDYRIGAVVIDSCNDTLGPLVLAGTRRQPHAQPILTTRVKVQIAVVVLLLVAYILLYRRVRRKTPQRQSLRR